MKFPSPLPSLFLPDSDEEISSSPPSLFLSDCDKKISFPPPLFLSDNDETSFDEFEQEKLLLENFNETLDLKDFEVKNKESDYEAFEE